MGCKDKRQVVYSWDNDIVSEGFTAGTMVTRVYDWHGECYRWLAIRSQALACGCLTTMARGARTSSRSQLLGGAVMASDGSAGNAGQLLRTGTRSAPV